MNHTVESQKQKEQGIKPRLVANLVQLVHSRTDRPEHISGDPADFEDTVKDLSVVYLDHEPEYGGGLGAGLGEANLPTSIALRISWTILTHSASGIIGSYSPAMSKSHW